MLIAALLLACQPGTASLGKVGAGHGTPAPHDTPTLPQLTATSSDSPETGTWLFQEQAARRVFLDLSDDARQRLRDEPREWVPAAFTVGDVHFDLVGVRLKGNGSFQPLDDKPSWKIDLDHYVPGQEVDGIDDLVLDNMSLDPTWLRARIAYQFYETMGLPAPRTTWVTLDEEGRVMRMLLSEDKDKRFLSRFYDDPDGSLYELFDADLTPELVPYLDHDGGPDDLRPFLELAEILDDPTSRLSHDAGHLLDVEQFARYFAVSGVIGQFDAYPYSIPGDDIYWYVDPADGRIDTLPHGVDETMEDPLRPVDYTVGVLGEACLHDPVCEQWWADATWEALDELEGGRWLQKVRDEHAYLVDQYDVVACDQALRADPLFEYTGYYDYLIDYYLELYGQTFSEVIWGDCASHYDMAWFLDSRREALESMPGLPR